MATASDHANREYRTGGSSVVSPILWRPEPLVREKSSLPWSFSTCPVVATATIGLLGNCSGREWKNHRKCTCLPLTVTHRSPLSSPLTSSRELLGSSFWSQLQVSCHTGDAKGKQKENSVLVWWNFRFWFSSPSTCHPLFPRVSNSRPQPRTGICLPG